MERVKTFLLTSTTGHHLEMGAARVNAWLSENSGLVKITRVLQSQSDDTVALTIFYENVGK